eukprot:1156224-Pelagomonas_calceolata.AAC.7
MHPPDASVMTAVCCTSALHRLAHCCVQTCVPASTSLFGFQSILCASQNCFRNYYFKVSEGIRGAVTGDGVNGVSYILYSDNLSLTTNDPGRVLLCLLSCMETRLFQRKSSLDTS